MLRRSLGIVLKTSPFGDADLIVTFLTDDFGIVKTFAKSPRKTKSRFGSSLEPLTCCRISFWGKEDAALPRLTQADIIHPFQSLRERLHCFLKVSELLELTISLVPERDGSKNVFDLLLSVLKEMEEGECAAPLPALYFKLKLMEIAGYLPGLDGCGRCGRPWPDFFVMHGSVLCRSCAGGVEATVTVSSGALSLFRTLLVWDRTKLARVKPQLSIVGELSGLIDIHVRHILERSLRTRAFSLS